MADGIAPDDEIEPGSGAIAVRWFPSGPATGRAYLARHEEHSRLFDDVLHGRSRWFDCPAQFGVGTLLYRLRNTLRHNHEPRLTSTELSLRGVHDGESFAYFMLRCFGRLAAKVWRHHAVQERLIAPLFPGTPKEIFIDDKHLQIIRFRPRDETAAAVRRLAAQIDALSESEGCRNLVYVRDSEQLAGLRDRDDAAALAADLLTAMPRTSWLFHGNNQQAMRGFFGVEAGPLHGRCLRFALRPIDADVYRAHIAAAAQARWNCLIGPKATNMMLALTRRHPLWMNTLCRRLWCADLPPLIQNVVNEWKAIAAELRPRFAREFELLTPNQRAVLNALSQSPTAHPRSKQFVARTRVSSASVGQAMSALIDRDLIETGEHGKWRVKDPLMDWSLRPKLQLVEAIYEGRRVAV